MERRKYGCALMIIFLMAFVLFTAVDKNSYKGQPGEMTLPAVETTLLLREGTAGTGADDPEGQGEPERAKEAIPNTNNHRLVGCMWMYYEDEEVPFVDEKTFELIWEAYREVDYSVECKKGDPKVYEEYKQKFWRLVRNEVPFLDRETGEEIYLKDWTDPSGVARLRYMDRAAYYFYDVSGDGLPELCVSAGYTAVFAYDAGADRITLWAWTGWSIIGTRTGAYYPNFDTEIGRFFRYDTDGDIELEILFWAERASRVGYDINMVMFPNYADREKRGEITEEMKQQGVYEESSGQWFFRITDEQFEKLSKPYVNLLRLAQWRRSEVVYTYEGLFGEYETE